MIEIRHGDCIAEMRAMDDACVDAIVTDPPYELGFMGKSWDSTDIANSVEMWREALRVLKPGGHMLAFSGTRTYHRMVCAIEDAGFEIRDCIRSLNGQDHYPAWVYGSGFPKSLDVSKAIDKAAGAEREVIGSKLGMPGYSLADNGRTNDVYGDLHAPAKECAITAPATPEAQQWAGWGTALKPAWEPICVARKPLGEKSVAANVLAHGTGAINIDGCRVASDESLKRTTYKIMSSKGAKGGALCNRDHEYAVSDDARTYGSDAGRWPANIIHDGSDEVLEAFAAFGERKGGGHTRRNNTSLGSSSGGIYGKAGGFVGGGHDGTGTAARFFYSAKASAKDRAGSKHPTVKPVSLMRYLCKLITPPGGTVLDPFAGSGTTLQAALEEGFHAIGIEQDATYVTDIRNRISAAREGLGLFAVAAE